MDVVCWLFYSVEVGLEAYPRRGVAPSNQWLRDISLRRLTNSTSSSENDRPRAGVKSRGSAKVVMVVSTGNPTEDRVLFWWGIA